MDKASQCERIVSYCKNHGSITNLQIVKDLDIVSASKRISEIRSDPRYRLEQEDVRVLDGEGKQRTHYCKYRITEVQDERCNV